MLHTLNEEMAASLKGRDFLALVDYSPEELRYLIDLAIDLKQKQKAGEFYQPLKGKTLGMIFEKSSTSLHLWFYAIYLITSTRCGISAKHLERELGVRYKTAWRMFNKIRNQLMNEELEPLSGEVELDEAA